MAHRIDRAGFDGPPGPDDRHPLAQRLDLGEDVARQQDGRTGRRDLVHALAKNLFHQRIQARGRFVEQQQPRVRGERGHQCHLLPVALRVGPGLLARVEVEPLDEFGAPGIVESATHAGEQVDGFAARQGRPQRHVAGHIGEVAVQGDGVAPRVAAEDSRVAGVGAQQAEQHPQRRRFAGAVRAEEAVHLARFDDEVEAVECSTSAVAPKRLTSPCTAMTGSVIGRLLR